MTQAKQGDTVKVHYTGRLADGTVFDSSTERGEPLTVKLGEGKLPPGFERALLGMAPGESKTEHVTPEEGFGERRQDLIVQVEKDVLPEGLDPKPGEPLQVQDENGDTYPVVVSDVAEDSVTLDANHPLAGQELEFDIELVEFAETP